MERDNQETEKKRMTEKTAGLRKKCIRFLAYIYAACSVLNKRMSVKAKKMLAEGICGVAVGALVLSSVAGQGGTSYKMADVSSENIFAGNRNQVANGQSAAKIEIHQSKVSESDSVDGKQVGDAAASKGTVSDILSDASGKKQEKRRSGGSKTGKNMVVENVQRNADSQANVVKNNPVPLSQISALYENNGEKRAGGEPLMFYQFPVALGYAPEINYDRVQTAGDYILNEVFVLDGMTTEEIKTQEPDAEKESELTTEHASEGDISDGNASEDENEADGEKTEDTDYTSGDGSDNKENTDRTGGENFENMEDADHTGKDGSENTEARTDGEEADTAEKKVTSDGPATMLQQSEYEQFRKSVWSAILSTAPVMVKQTDEEKAKHTKAEKPSYDVLEEPEREDMTEEGRTEEDTPSEEDDEEKPVIADAEYFTVRGSMRAGTEFFVGGIIIEPTGVNGFDKVRLGEEGEFHSAVTLMKEAVEETVTLYFSDGETVSTGVEYTYSKDAVAPVPVFDEETFTKLKSDDKTVICTNEQKLPVTFMDNTNGTGLDKICYVYGNKLKYVIDNFEEAGVQVPDNFFGNVLMNCSDKAGNTSDIVLKYYLVENNAPDIRFSEDRFCTTPYTFWVDVEDSGHIVSGIKDISCTVNGEEQEITNLTPLENVTLDKGLEVLSKCEFSLLFEQEGSYNISVAVTDNAGNVTIKEEEIVVGKPELVSVFMPERFTIHIDPQQLAGREQVFSDDITLKNDSDIDVKVTVKNIEVYIKDEVSDTGVKKDCELYMIAPDTGERIALKKGSNKNAYTYTLPIGAEGDISKLRFVGDTTEGSDAMWKDSDIAVTVNLEFAK